MLVIFLCLNINTKELMNLYILMSIEKKTGINHNIMLLYG